MPKGSEAALWILAFIRGFGGETCVPFYVFALVHFTRFRLVRWRAVSFSFLRLRQKQTLPLCNALRGCKHCFRRTLAYCTYCGEIVGIQRITNVLQTLQSGGCGSANLSTAPHPKGTSSGDADAPPSGRSTQRRGNKRSAPQGYLLRGAAADLIASNAPLRKRRHKARQNPVPH